MHLCTLYSIFRTSHKEANVVFSWSMNSLHTVNWMCRFILIIILLINSLSLILNFLYRPAFIINYCYSYNHYSKYLKCKRHRYKESQINTVIITQGEYHQGKKSHSHDNVGSLSPKSQPFPHSGKCPRASTTVQPPV